MTSVCLNTELDPRYVRGRWEDESLLRPGGLDLTKRAMALCRVDSNACVLDLGCGAGISSRYLRKGLGFEVIGIDVSLAACREARETAEQVVQADARHLPLPSASIDAVLAECSLSLMDKTKVLGECFRVLKPTGRLILTDIYVRNVEAVARLRELGGACFSQVMSQDELETELARHEFEIERWEDHSSLLKPLLFRWLMQHGSLGPLFACEGSAAEPDSTRLQQALREARLGYFLLIAVKQNAAAVLAEGETS
ncbi:MAG TPA: class I SAM-dependent methyltransferase [Terriglobales bacterium]|nr:class I SAM-dependent methyltransferase [Terriglobales bacterium]